jgi:hypothetical protein
VDDKFVIGKLIGAKQVSCGVEEREVKRCRAACLEQREFFLGVRV